MLAPQTVSTGLKALAVGQHKGCWDTLRSALEEAGFDIQRSQKTAVAREAFGGHDLVVLDLNAGESGELESLIAWLREESGRPIYLLGAGSPGKTSREALVAKLRLNDFVPLPIDPGDLRQRLVSFDRWRKLRFHRVPAELAPLGEPQPFFTTRHAAASEDPARIFLREAPIGVAMLNRDLRYVLANRRWLEQFDLGDADLAGRSHLELFPDLHETWKPVYDACLRGEIRRGTEPLPGTPGCPGGELRWEVRPWHNGSGHIGGISICFEELWDPAPRTLPHVVAPESPLTAVPTPPGQGPATPETPDPSARVQDHAPAVPGSVPAFPEILEALPAGVVLLGPGGKPMFANRRHAELLGRSVTSCGDMETWLAEGCPDPAQRERLLESWRTDVWQRQVTRVYNLFDTNGSLRILRIQPQLLLPENQLLLTLNDVTDEKRQEQALRDSEMRFRALFRDSGVGIALTDAAHQLHDINPALEVMLGRPKRSVRGHAFSELVHPDDRARLEQELQLLAASGERHRTLDLRLLPTEASAGEAVWARVQVCAVRDAQKELLFGAIFVHDETAERVARSELEICQEQNRALLEASLGSILLTDRSGQIIEWVEGAGSPFAMPDLKQAPGSVESVIPAFKDRAVALIADAYAKEQAVGFDFVHENTAGISVPCRARIAACRPHDAVIFIQADAAPLAAADPSQEESVAAAQPEAIAHERIRNNLQVVHALVNLPFQEDRTLLPWNAVLVTRNRVRALYRVHRLTSVESGRERVDFKQFAQEHAADLLESYHCADRIKFHADFEVSDFELAVASPLALIFNELASNALAHGFPGDTRGSILARIRRDSDGRLSLSIVDDGLGIRTDAQQEPHSGLGLKLAQRLAQRIGGSCEEVESTETEFVVYFGERVGE